MSSCRLLRFTFCLAVVCLWFASHLTAISPLSDVSHRLSFWLVSASRLSVPPLTSYLRLISLDRLPPTSYFSAARHPCLYLFNHRCPPLPAFGALTLPFSTCRHLSHSNPTLVPVFRRCSLPWQRCSTAVWSRRPKDCRRAVTRPLLLVRGASFKREGRRYSKGDGDLFESGWRLIRKRLG